MAMNEVPENETEQQEDTGAKTFTQEEVDEIVRKRLARERRKADTDQTPDPDRESALDQRELALMAKEKLLDQGLPLNLAGVLKYSDEKTLDEAIKALKNLEKEPPKSWGQRLNGHKSQNDPIREAFKPR